MKYKKNQKDLRGRKKDRAVQKNTERKVRQESKKLINMEPSVEEQERAAQWVAENVDNLPQNIGELVAELTLYTQSVSSLPDNLEEEIEEILYDTLEMSHGLFIRNVRKASKLIVEKIKLMKGWEELRNSGLDKPYTPEKER